MIAANLPDIDVAVHLFNSGLAFRRGWTHGVLAIVLLPLLLTLLMVAWDRGIRRRRHPEAPPAIPAQLLLVSTIGVLSHPFLDWLNTYGLRWLMPFDGTWFYGDALFIVDPWLWLALFLGYIVARRRTTGAPAHWALGAAAAYIALMLGTAAAGRTMVAGAMAERGIAADRVLVAPVPIDPNRRDVLIDTGDRYYRGTLHWLPRPRLVVHEGAIPPNLDHPLALQVTGDPEVARFLVWARFPFVRIEGPPDERTVVFDDLRYTSGESPSWAAVTISLSRAEPPSPVRAPVFETAASLLP